MLFGYINKTLIASPPPEEPKKILNDLLWKGSKFQSFLFGSINGNFITDKHLPEKKPTEVCYINAEENVLVLVDGYLYNKEEIFTLLGKGIKEVETAELIYWAYQKWGIYFAEKLNGDFAIVIHSKFLNQTIFIRDHLGIRPLVVSQSDNYIYFSTDAMGLCKALFPNEKIEQEYLLNFFLAEVRNYDLLPQNKVFKIKPGHYCLCSSIKQEQYPYWNPEKIKSDKKLTQKKVIQDLEKLLTDAVAIRSDSRFNASAHVSGGLDSGIIAVLARNNYSSQKNFYGFSWSPDNEERQDNMKLDERELVDKICKKYKIMPVYTNYGRDDYLEFLSNWRCPSEFLYERITLKSARSYGVNLIFSGWGGDEFISIGDYGIDTDLIRSLDIYSFFKKYPPRNFRNLISILYRKALVPSLRISHKPKIKNFVYLKKQVSSCLVKSQKHYKINTRRDHHLYFLRRNQLSARTADWYVHGQRNGIEYRYPLLDKRIVEYMLKVPSRCLVNGKQSRVIIREICKEVLPLEVIYNVIKDDPISSYRYDSIVKGLENVIKDEYVSYRNNPELSFIDFDTIDIQLRENEKNKKNKNELFILYYLKWIHEFTKSYYGSKSQ